MGWSITFTPIFSQEIINKLNKKSIAVEFSEFNFADLSNLELNLYHKALEGAHNAYAPYSKFYVGASVLLENNEVIVGNNQENSAYPSGMCAERVALFHAGSIFPNVKVKAIGITIDFERCPQVDIAFPCGGCRQAMSEYEYLAGNPIDIYIFGKNESGILLSGVKQLLPFTFAGDFLKK